MKMSNQDLYFEQKTKLENEQIAIYWWNFGRKTLDYKGSYKGYLNKRNIKVKQINHPIQTDIKGWQFSISVSTGTITLDIFDYDYMRCCDEAIKLFLTIMGDKTKFETPCRTFRLNW